MAAALADRALGAIVGSAVADAAGKMPTINICHAPLLHHVITLL